MNIKCNVHIASISSEKTIVSKENLNNEISPLYTLTSLYNIILHSDCIAAVCRHSTKNMTSPFESKTILE